MQLDRKSAPEFDAEFCDLLDALLTWRRDVRRFKRNDISESVTQDLLKSILRAPSVGNSQPTRIVRVATDEARALVKANFEATNANALAAYKGNKAEKYVRLKLAGLDDAPLQLAIFCNEDPVAGHGLGRKTMPETVRYSTVCAIHTLWLFARARGLGVGWVSILDPARLAADLETPRSWAFIGYLCVGEPEDEHEDPELARVGWQDRQAFSELVFEK
jgi:5,6-dimethylbenzimidazole synthase